MKPHGHLRSVFCVILLVLRPWIPAAGADPIDEGRASLVAYKQKPHPAAALMAADQAFARAQQQNPGSVEANVYRALTRFLVLMHEDPIRARLSEFGWSEEGRNYWAWAATLPPTLPKPGIESETVTDILDDTVLPEVDLVLADLDSVPKDWSGSFLISSNEIPSKGDREMDVGDVAVLSFFLHGLKASLLLQSAYDTQATIDRAFAVNEKGTLTTLPISLNGDVLERFPRFGSVIEEKRIQEAEQAAEAANAAFHRARSLIEQETDNQKDDLFSIDMVKWAAPFVESMNAPQTITFAEGMTGLLDGRRLFRAPYVQKAQLPEFNDRNDVVLGTFPDPTFNGVFPDMTQAKLSLLLRWMHRKSPTQKDLFGVAYGNNLYVAVGESGTILTSSDSREWVLAEGPVSKTLKSVCFGNGFFVAVGEEGQVAVSGDGKTWMVRDSGTAAKLEAVAYARGRFIAVGEEGQILTSASGQAWDRSESGVSETLRGVAGNERGWVAVGNRGLVLQSVDGQSWKRRDTGVSDALLGVLANRDGYTVTGYKGLLMTSSMGEEWTVRASGVDRSLHAACEQDGLILAVGEKGTMVGASDPSSWSRQINRSRTTLWSIAAGPEQVVTVGNSGHILACENANLSRGGVGGRAALPSFVTRDEVEQQVRQWFRRSRTRVVDSRNTLLAEQGSSRVQPGLVILPQKGPALAVLLKDYPEEHRDANAWIGFYEATEEEDRNYLSYTFLKNLVHDTYDVPIPATSGTYEFRLFRDGDYDRIATSEPIEVP